MASDKTRYEFTCAGCGRPFVCDLSADDVAAMRKEMKADFGYEGDDVHEVCESCAADFWQWAKDNAPELPGVKSRRLQ